MVNVVKSLKVANQIPQFFDFEGSQLVAFMAAYYEWMESFGPDFYSRRITDYNDIDFRKDSHEIFDEFLRSEFLKFVPNKLQVDDRLLIKNIRDFYKSKGTEDSVKILFRILYNEDVEFEYPGKYMLRASDGRWNIDRSLKIVLIVDGLSDISLYDFVVGAESGAAAKIQKVEQKLVNSVIETELFYTDKFGSFIPGEQLNSRITKEPLAILINEIDAETIYPGKYVTTDGFLSWDRVIQDSHYYQDFSYVIKSARDSKEYADILKQLTHPAGTIFFTEYNLRVDINNVFDERRFEKLYSKQIQYTIDLQDMIQLNLESDVSQGSYTGKYIFEYDLVFSPEPYIFSSQTTYPGSLQDPDVLNIFESTTDIVGLEVNDIVEIYDSVEERTYHLRVKTVHDIRTFETYRDYPYGAGTDLVFKVFKKDKDDSVNNIRNRDIGAGNGEILSLTNYPDFNNLSYEEIDQYTYSELLQDKYLQISDLASLPIVRGTIISISDNINNHINDYYVRETISDDLIVFYDEYTDVTTTNLNYTVTNI